MDMLFKLLRSGLETVETGGCGSFEVVQWGKMYKFGVRHGVSAILLDGLQKAVERGMIGEGMMPGREVRMRWMSDCVNLERVCSRQYHLSSELAENFAGKGVRTVVLKGIAAGECYPVPFHRPCGDLDCFLMGDYEKGNVIAESMGAKVVRDHYKHSHILYKALEVENHQFCTGVRGSRKAKDFERLLQGLLKDEGTSYIGETRLECPPPMFNALFLTHHSQRHYLSEGIALRHLCDWAMFVKVHGGDVDWGRFRAVAKEYGLVAFADSMTRISERYLGVPVPAGYEAAADDELDMILLNDIMAYQKPHEYGNAWKVRWQVARDLFRFRYRYRKFSDTSMLSSLLTLFWGFLTDRNPKL